MRLRIPAVCALLLVAIAAPASAQAVKLEFARGRVTLVARNVPVRAILTEWTRLGGTRIVGGDALAGPPLTLELTGVSEREALDVLLRGVAGYMITTRAAAAAGASVVDRIMILPTSTPPRAGSAAAAFGAPPPPQFGTRPEEDPTERPVSPGRVVIGRPAGSAPGGVTIGGAPEPFPSVVETPAAAPPPPPAPASRPSTFTTLPGSSRPGEITPVPQQPSDARQPPRPPQPNAEP